MSSTQEAGATLTDNLDDVYGADVVVKVAPPNAEEAVRLKSSGVLIGFLQPLTNGDGIRAIAQTGVTSFAMEAIPRISPRPVHGRAVKPGEHRRLQGGADRVDGDRALSARC